MTLSGAGRNSEDGAPDRRAGVQVLTAESRHAKFTDISYAAVDAGYLLTPFKNTRRMK
jgi:hypothetical protein